MPALLDNGQIETVAGGGVGDGALGTAAFVNLPFGADYDASGNLYIADSENHRIRRVDARTGIITTVAGNGHQGFSGDGGPAKSASLNAPSQVALDPAGNIFLADSLNSRIRRVDAQTGTITTVAGNGNDGFSGDGGPALNAGMSPVSVDVDKSGNLYLADPVNQRIRRVDAQTKAISTVAGNGTEGFSGDNGPATSAALRFPLDVRTDASGNILIADTENQRIRRVDVTTRIITTVAGSDSEDLGDGGPATQAGLFFPNGVAADASGNLFIADSGNNLVRRVDNATKVIRTIAGDGFFDEDGFGRFTGDGGPATQASLSYPAAVAVNDQSSELAIVDVDNYRVRIVSSRTQTIGTVAGIGFTNFSGDNGPANQAGLSFPASVVVDGAGNLLIADTGNHRIRRVNPQTGIITTIAGNGITTPDGSGTFSGDGGSALRAGLNFPTKIILDRAGNIVFADTGNQRIRRITADGTITTLAGNGNDGFSGDGGPATRASLNFPFGVALDGSGNLLIADTDNHRVRRVDAVSGNISTIAGNGKEEFSGDNGPATSAGIWFPFDVALDGNGNLLIADSGFTTVMDEEGVPGSIEVPIGNNRIRRVDAKSGTISTLAGNGRFSFSGDNGPASNAAIYFPRGLVTDSTNTLFFSDETNQRIRKIDPAGLITTIAGNGRSGSLGDGGPATSAALRFPQGVALDNAGNLFLADTENGLIRVVRGVAAVGAKVTITGVDYTKPSLTITGTGFGTSGNQVRVNGTDVSGFLKSQSATTLSLKGSSKKLGLQKGANQISVIAGGTTSNTFTFNF